MFTLISLPYNQEQKKKYELPGDASNMSTPLSKLLNHIGSFGMAFTFRLSYVVSNFPYHITIVLFAP